jgi:ABC-2 type transport system permease protein
MKGKFQRFLAIVNARNREFLRDRAALSWNILFPILIIAGFAFAFSGGERTLYKIGIYNPDKLPYKTHSPFFSLRYSQFISTPDLNAAINKVQRHQLDILFDIGNRRYWINEDSANGYILESLLLPTSNIPLKSNEQNQLTFEKQSVTGDQIRYIDWLIPGIMAMNMMFSALFGVGYVIVRYRKNGVLKRLKATPLSAMEFLAAQVTSRYILVMIVTILVYSGVDIFVGFRMNGSYFDLFLLFSLGTLSMISMGLLVAARISSEETAGGLLNVISWPMMFLSGVWFSLEGLNPLIQQLAQIFPLTHLITGARAIMIDGSGLANIYPQAGILAIMTIVFLLAGAYSFDWE